MILCAKKGFFRPEESYGLLVLRTQKGPCSLLRKEKVFNLLIALTVRKAQRRFFTQRAKILFLVKVLCVNTKLAW